MCGTFCLLLCEPTNKCINLTSLEDTITLCLLVMLVVMCLRVQVSPQEMVQEIHQVLMDREDTCHRTCFSLQLDGNVLDNFAELKSIEGLQEGSVLKVVEGEPPLPFLFCFFSHLKWCFHLTIRNVVKWFGLGKIQIFFKCLYFHLV